MILGPDLVIAAPGGDLSVAYGTRLSIQNGFVVESGASLTIVRDATLEFVMPELVEAERARRAARPGH